MTSLPPSPFITESSTSTGGHQEAPAEVVPHATTAGLLPADIPLDDLIARGFDVEAFMNDIQPLPAFISNPSPEYLRANEMIPMLAVLAGH